MEKYIQKWITYIDDYKKASNASSGSAVDQNANVTTKNIATLAAELPKKDNIKLQRAIMCHYITKLYGKELAEQYIEDLNNHIIYRHDETSGSGGFVYCASISLYPFILNGLKDLGGSSEPPKHANSFIGGLINLLFLVSGQFIGAVAASETLTYLDWFLRRDYGEDYVDHLDEKVEVLGNHQICLRKKIYDLFQQFVFTINQPAGARGYQSPFINIAYFDKYYFESIFKDFIFPDGNEPKWETTKELQKLFMNWFNEERRKTVLTFPVETFNILVDKETGEYADKETADFIAEMWSKGHSFFCYQSDSVDSLSSCCRLRNGIEDNVFSYTLGAGGIMTGSKAVITLNLNRIVQNWKRSADFTKEYNKFCEEGKEIAYVSLPQYIASITERVHKYLTAFNNKAWDDFDANLLTVYQAGYIELDKQYLTIGVNGFLEAAEFLGIHPDPNNPEYKKFAQEILGTIEALNKKDRTEHEKFNLEFVPGENLSYKMYNWDKAEGYKVPENRNMYTSYFYPVEDKTVDPVKKFYYQGKGFADICSGGVALHNNLSEHLSQQQYRHLMDVAVKAGCNYWTFNIPNTICNKCGHISKNYLDHCEECGSEDVDYITRIIGYLKRISNFSEARQVEAKRRFYGKINTKKE